jgi:hypothetical protein
MLLVPLMESLFGRLRDISMSPPSVQVIVEHEAWRDLQTGFHGIGSHAIDARVTEHLARHDHGFFLDELDLVFLLQHLPPGIDLIMDVDFHRSSDVGVTAFKVDEKGNSHKRG